MTATQTIHPLHTILESLNIKVNIIGRPTSLTKDKEGWDHFAWSARLERRNDATSNKPDAQTEDIPYKMGSAHVEPLNDLQRMRLRNYGDKPVRKPKAPDAATIVHSLLMDSEACEMSHEDWCANCGYEEDSRKGMDIYLACQKSGRIIRSFLGKDLEAVKEAAQDF